MIIAENGNVVQQIIIKLTAQGKVCTLSACLKTNFLDYAAESACLHVITEKK